MLKDADPKYFAGIYIVCGYTDLRYGIDSLAAIIERKCHANMFVPNTLFLFVADLPRRSKDYFGKVMAFCFYTSVWKAAISHGPAVPMNFVP